MKSRVKKLGNRLPDSITGNRIGIRTIGKYMYAKGVNHFWEVHCDCGKTQIISETAFRISKKISKSCGCLKKIGKGESSINNIINRYKRDAKIRSINYELLREEFKFLIFLPCHYCQKKPSQEVKDKKVNFFYNGIDRIDNELGYLWQNCVPCCKECNLAKKSVTKSIIEKMLEFIKDR